LAGRNPNDDSEPFNMAYLALRGCGALNGVSRLHGEVSRRIFQSLFPRWPEREVPVGHVTNGVHAPSWDRRMPTPVDGRMREAPLARDHGDGGNRVSGGSTIPALARSLSGQKLSVEYTRKRLARQRASQGASAQEVRRLSVSSIKML